MSAAAEITRTYPSIPGTYKKTTQTHYSKPVYKKDGGPDVRISWNNNHEGWCIHNGTDYDNCEIFGKGCAHHDQVRDSNCGDWHLEESVHDDISITPIFPES